MDLSAKSFIVTLKLISAFFIIWNFQVPVFGQTKKTMTPEVYSRWNKIRNVAISDSGETVIYTLEKELGDKTLYVYDGNRDSSFTFPRATKQILDPSGRFVIFSKGLADDSIRSLKRKKTPKDKMPADTLVVVDVRSGNTSEIPDIKEFSVPGRYSGILAYTLKSKPAEKKDSTDSRPTKKPPCEKQTLIIRHLATGREDTLMQAGTYKLAEESPYMLYTRCTGDSTARWEVIRRNVETGAETSLATALHKVENLSCEKSGRVFAFLALKEKSDAIQKPYSLLYATAIDSVARTTDLSSLNGVKNGLVASTDRSITFSESGKRMFFGMAPVRPVRDTTLLEDEVVNVEIWHHDSPRLYTQMDARKEEDRKKSYLTLFDMTLDTVVRLENEDTTRCMTSFKGDGRLFLQLRERPYLKTVTWLGENAADLILYDTENHSQNLLSTGESGNPSFSPQGRYIFWWNRQDSIWKVYDSQKSLLGVLGLWSDTKYHDELNDVPQKAGPYGIAGWTNGDHSVLVYDRYDIWKIDPSNPLGSVRLTQGRESNFVYRLIDTDEENQGIDTSKYQLLHLTSETDKSESYALWDMKTHVIRNVTGGSYSLTRRPDKARKAEKYVFTRENFQVFPDLLLADSSFTGIKKISHANPWQDEYGWGTAKLFVWKNLNGLKNEGMLFFPPDFDPDKKYPLIVNFYERSSQDLHRHRAPEAHRSSINYTYYTNNGYVIFNPDISYTTGQPGEDCYNAVESGVDALLKLGYIDESRMALQGHSWGGYQVAYLLTKTGRFRCAEAGAPVVNMVSAYGGVRWESGMSRMFQYEKAQSRLGVTLWDDPSLYHKNSPVYHMHKVTTPVLIMHNDHDGAVPWEQGIEYYMALRRLGKEAWLLNYNGEPHWPVKWQNRLDFNIRMQQFFDFYLRQAPMPAWMKTGNTPLDKGILRMYDR